MAPRGAQPKFTFERRGRYHGAREWLTGVVQRPYVQDAAHYKPSGFWYSVGASWWEWMRFDIPDWWDDFRAVTRLDVDTSRLLVLDTVRKIEEFTTEYGVSNWNDMRGPPHVINWRRVEPHYAGVEIAPYQPSLRLTLPWYYPWDAASGCIWDVSAIRGIEHATRLPRLVKGAHGGYDEEPDPDAQGSHGR